MNTIKRTPIHLVLAALTALALLAGCSQPEQGGGSAAEKKEFAASVSEPAKGVLKVTVAGTAVSASFLADGKTYAGTGTVGTDGAVSVDLSSEADTANTYRFTGTYDTAAKRFTKAQFGTQKMLHDVSFDGKQSGKPRSLYTGTVHGFGLQEYDLTVLVKSESKATILFSRKAGFDTDYGKDHPKKRESIYYEVEGNLSGNKLTANVRLEGEDFRFETVLNDDGYLRQTRLIGERAYTGDRNPTFIYEYEAKNISDETSATGKKAVTTAYRAARFNGDLSITIHLSIASYRTLSSQPDEAELGKVFVNFLDLTEKTAGTRRYKMAKTLTRKNYREGMRMTLYNVLDRRSEIFDYNPEEDLTPEQKKEYGKNLGEIDSGRVAVAFVFNTPKAWFDLETQELRKAPRELVFTLGRAYTYNTPVDNLAVAEIPVSMLKRIK